MFCSVHVPSFVGGEVIYVCEHIEEEEAEVQAMHGVTVYQVCNLGVNKNCKSCQVWQSQRYYYGYRHCQNNVQTWQVPRVHGQLNTTPITLGRVDTCAHARCPNHCHFTLITCRLLPVGFDASGKLTGAALSLNMSRVSKQREWSDAVSKEASYERSVVCRFVWKVEGLGSAILSSRIVELDRWLLTGEFMREVYELSVGGVRVRKCAFGIQICSGKGKWEKGHTG